MRPRYMQRNEVRLHLQEPRGQLLGASRSLASKHQVAMTLTLAAVLAIVVAFAQLAGA
jgi:hypothetical protein